MIFFTFGCGKEKYSSCNINIDNTLENYSKSGTYKIYYDKTFATKIVEEEVYNSSNQDTLEYLEESSKLKYNNLKDLYGGYDFDIKLNGDNLTIKSTINLEEVDLKEMVKNKDINDDYVKANKLTFTGAKHIYEDKGAICED